MTAALKSRISSIKDEVKELHPLLDTIFNKMPTLIKSEYTHGPNEKGADFILTKISEELGDTEYIGVIVKSGKITQSCQDVLTQIDECTLKRISTNGKKEIYLSEVWVVANGVISANAKEKIYDKFKTQKIKFIDLNMLYQLTSDHYPDFAIDIDVRCSNYLTLQREESTKRVSNRSLLLIENNRFIDQDIVKLSPDFSKRDEKVDILEEINSNKVVFIEAPMGGGKSRLVDQIISKFTELESYNTYKTVPIFFDAKVEELARLDGLQELISEICAEHDLDKKNIHNYLVIIDGLDEIQDDSASQKITSFINEVNASENLKLVITSRLIDDSYFDPSVDSKCQKYRILPLNLNRVISYIQNVCSHLNIKHRLIEDLKKSELFKVLPKTPISAIILAKLMSEGSGDLPANITELYSQYCELSLGRWDIEKGLKTTKQYEALDKVISIIAKYMIDHSLPMLSIDEALQIFRDYLERRNLQLDHKKLFLDVMERSDLLAYGEGNKTIMFKHRSFAEFFYAKYLFSSTDNVQIDQKIFHPYWSNIYFFYVGLRRDCPELLNTIVDLPPEHEGYKLSKLINMGNFLLAGYQTPYDVITEALSKIFQEYGSYYQSVFTKQEDSFFSQFPPMHFLSMLRHMLAENYSYEFFLPAINQTLEDIGTKPNMLDADLYTLLFLDLAIEDMSSDNSFERLISNGDSLPMPIQMAIAGCGQSGKYDSQAMKKFVKRFNKRARTSKVVNDYLKDLINQSIDGSLDLRQASPKKLTSQKSRRLKKR